MECLGEQYFVNQLNHVLQSIIIIIIVARLLTANRKMMEVQGSKWTGWSRGSILSSCTCWWCGIWTELGIA